jgi:hypothetical protein
MDSDFFGLCGDPIAYPNFLSFFQWIGKYIARGPRAGRTIAKK